MAAAVDAAAAVTAAAVETAAAAAVAATERSRRRSNASITLEVPDEVLAQRKAKYVAPEPNIKTGWLSRYARMVTSANLGAVLK